MFDFLIWTISISQRCDPFRRPLRSLVFVIQRSVSLSPFLAAEVLQKNFVKEFAKTLNQLGSLMYKCLCYV